MTDSWNSVAAEPDPTAAPPVPDAPASLPEGDRKTALLRRVLRPLSRCSLLLALALLFVPWVFLPVFCGNGHCTQSGLQMTYGVCTEVSGSGEPQLAWATRGVPLASAVPAVGYPLLLVVGLATSFVKRRDLGFRITNWAGMGAAGALGCAVLQYVLPFLLALVPSWPLSEWVLKTIPDVL